MEDRNNNAGNDDSAAPTFTFGGTNNPTGGVAAPPGAGNGPNPFAFLFPSLFNGGAPAPAGPAPAGRGAASGGGRGGGGAKPPPIALNPNALGPNNPLSFLFSGAGGAPPFGAYAGDSDDDDDDDGSALSYAEIKEQRKRMKGKEVEPDRAYVLSMFAPSQPLQIEPSDKRTVLELKKDLLTNINFRKLPLENIALYFRNKRMQDERQVVDYIYNGNTKMVCIPANLILRYELHDTMEQEEGLTFNNLPNELLLSVLRFLDMKTLLQLCFVNKHLRLLASSDTLWKPLYGILWSLQDFIRMVDQEDPTEGKAEKEDREAKEAAEKNPESSLTLSDSKKKTVTEDDLCFSCYGLISDQKAGKKIEKVYLKDRLTWKERFKQREDMLKEQSMEEVQRRAAVKEHMKPLVVDIAKGTTKPLNISVIKSCATGSISFGAPAFNRGDEMACFRFYYNTQRHLVSLMKSLDPTLKSYSPSTLKGLAYMEEALQMCKMDEKRWSHRKMNAEFREEEESPARHAWRLRFAFDRATNLWKIMETNFGSLRSIAGEYFRRFQLEEAVAALDEAQLLLDDICYEVPMGSTERRSDSYIDRFLIYFDIANLRFGLGQFEEAARNLKIGYGYIPNNTEDFSFDLSIFKRRDGGTWQVVLAWFKELEQRKEQERNEAKKQDLNLLYDWIKRTLKV